MIILLEKKKTDFSKLKGKIFLVGSTVVGNN